jgi:hypothetical protein
MKAKMKTNDPKLSVLLREARRSPALPARFQQTVWRRIELTEAPVKSDSWLEALAAMILRPRWAFASAAMLVFAGVWLGAGAGSEIVRQDSQARYLASVTPESHHHP